MASNVDICNLALSMLGETANVSSITPPEGSVRAEQCARFYPIARDAVLSLVQPPYAVKRLTLALLEPAEQPDIWSYAYAYPDSIKVLSVGLPEATMVDADRQEWDSEALEDGSVVIYTNSEEATVRILARITDTSKFGPLMVIAIARKLAAMLAGTIVKGIEGMKVSAAHDKMFDDRDLPRASNEAKSQKRDNSYMDHVPTSIAARA